MKACPQCFSKDVGFGRITKTDKTFPDRGDSVEEVAGKLLQKEYKF